MSSDILTDPLKRLLQTQYFCVCVSGGWEGGGWGWGHPEPPVSLWSSGNPTLYSPRGVRGERSESSGGEGMDESRDTVYRTSRFLHVAAAVVVVVLKALQKLANQYLKKEWPDLPADEKADHRWALLSPVLTLRSVSTSLMRLPLELLLYCYIILFISCSFPHIFLVISWDKIWGVLSMI